LYFLNEMIVFTHIKLHQNLKKICTLELDGGNKLNLFQRMVFVFSDVTFLKPFGFLVVIYLVGMEWTSLPAIAFYMVPLLM
jgi:hypothetical protein